MTLAWVRKVQPRALKQGPVVFEKLHGTHQVYVPIIHLDQGPESLLIKSSREQSPKSKGNTIPIGMDQKSWPKMGLRILRSHIFQTPFLGFRAKKKQGMNSPVASNRSGQITRIHQPEKLGPISH